MVELSWIEAENPAAARKLWFRVICRVEGGVLRVTAVMGREQDFDPQRFLKG
jgi:hypothetical protein